MMDIKTYVEQVTDKKKIEPYKVGFNLGLTHGLEIAVGFAEWYNEGRWFHDNIEQREHSTEELLCYYLDTLKTK